MTLDLFSPQPQTNLLPCDGVVEDHGLILNGEQSQKYLDYFLQHLAWEQDEVFLLASTMSLPVKLPGMVMQITNTIIRAA